MTILLRLRDSHKHIYLQCPSVQRRTKEFKLSVL